GGGGRGGCLGREGGGARRADVLVSLGSRRIVAADGRRRGATPVARGGRRGPDRALHARRRVHERALAHEAVRPSRRRGRAGGDDARARARDPIRLRGRGLARAVADPRGGRRITRHTPEGAESMPTVRLRDASEYPEPVQKLI